MNNDANDNIAGAIIEDEEKILNRQRNLILFIVALDIVILLCSYDINTILDTIWHAVDGIGTGVNGIVGGFDKYYTGPLPS